LIFLLTDEVVFRRVRRSSEAGQSGRTCEVQKAEFSVNVVAELISQPHIRIYGAHVLAVRGAPHESTLAVVAACTGPKIVSCHLNVYEITQMKLL